MSANAVLTGLRDDTLELINVVVALGPGQGNDRMLIIVRNEESITLNGYEAWAEQDFPDATDEADLTTKAQEFLAERSIARYSSRGETILEESVEPGDKVRLVSSADGINEAIDVSGVTESYENGSFKTTLDTGTTLSDVIKKATDQNKDKDKDRGKKYSLDPPSAFKLLPGSPGLIVTYAQLINTLAAGVEAHISETPLQEPNTKTVVDLGTLNPISIPTALTGDTRYYVKIRTYTADKSQFSAWTSELNELAGFTDLGPIEFTDITGELTEAQLEASIQEALDSARIDHDVLNVALKDWTHTIEMYPNSQTYGGAEGSYNGTIHLSGPANGTASVTIDVTTNGFPATNLRPNTLWARAWLVIDVVAKQFGIAYWNGSAWQIHAPAGFTNFPTEGTHFFIGQVEMDSATHFTSATIFEQVLTAIEYSAVLESNSKHQTIVAKLNPETGMLGQYSAITQLSDEIDLRVRSDELISSINISPEAIRISSDKVLIGNFRNLVGNPTFITPDGNGSIDGWTGIAASVAKTNAAVPGSCPTNFAGKLSQRDAYSSKAWEVQPGEVYLVSAVVATLNSSNQIRCGLHVMTTAGVNAWYAVQTINPTSTWTTLKGQITIPANVVKARFWIGINAFGSYGDWYFTNCVMDKANDANLIVPGAVTASKILVDDEIIIASNAQTQGRLSVQDPTLGEVLRLGRIAGKAGVPGGVTYGLWGAQGTGVFIQKVPKLEFFGSIEKHLYPLSGSGTIFKQFSETIYSGSLTLNDNERLICQGTFNDVSSSGNYPILGFGATFRINGLGQNEISGPVEITSIEMFFSATFNVTTNLPNDSCNVDVSYQIYRVID